MRTDFSVASLADPDMATSESVIRKCVHCGFCLSTCPTYALLGDERDSPRGRIYMIKTMLEEEAPPTPEIVTHIDRCLSCLSCMTTCPSGVDYRRLIDHARVHTERTYRRPLPDRLVRALLAAVIPHPRRFRLALMLARAGRPFARLFSGWPAMKAMLDLAPSKMAPRASATAVEGNGRGRVAILQGCAEPVLRPEIRAATVRLLGRIGYDAVFVPGEGCCGALVHHIGREEESLAAARRNVDAWCAEIDRRGLAAIITTAAGCGSMIKDYGTLLRHDPAYAERAARVSALAMDVSELLTPEDVAGAPRDMTIAYQSACSLRHGQRIVSAPVMLLRAAGFTVREPAEPHICCGSAGVYNITQPRLSAQLRDRKLGHLARLEADVIATGNIGCATQLASGAAVPVVHVVELLDWATGGPVPARLSH